MKRILWLFVLVSSTAFANSDADFAKAWIKKTVGTQTGTHIVGHTPLGQSCALYLTDDLNGDGTGVYRVMVGDDVDFIGATLNAQANVAADPSLMIVTDVNTVGIRMDDGGAAVRAVGNSPSHSIDCRFN